MGVGFLSLTEADVFRRLESEYREMPGLMLTPQQAARLVAMPAWLVCLTLERLVQTGFLRKSDLGTYLRA